MPHESGGESAHFKMTSAPASSNGVGSGTPSRVWVPYSHIRHKVRITGSVSSSDHHSSWISECNSLRGSCPEVSTPILTTWSNVRLRFSACATGRSGILLLTAFLCGSCAPPPARQEPQIEFTRLPPAGDGSPEQVYPIAGRVTGAGPGDRIVLFARSGVWWVQPTADNPFTRIASDASWKSDTHPGSAYAALLVNSDFQPPPTTATLPAKGGAILAVALAEGPMLSRPEAKTLRFSGYEWQARNTVSSRGGTRNVYDPANAWVDDKGFLHLRITKRSAEWTSAEVTLLRSLGYGSYRFVVRDISRLEPAAVFSIFTWDDAGPPREVNIEISRWGETTSKNAQYVIQPYYVPANVVRFTAPTGTLTHWLIWDIGRIHFRTARGSDQVGRSPTVKEHAFTSGIPTPGGEAIHLNLYVYDNRRNPLVHGAEVIIEEFEYLP